MTKVCANPECGIEFEPNAHNAKYCSPECRRLVTNKRVLERYHESKEKNTDKRVCKTCDTVLSQYNPDSICGSCKDKKLKKKAKKWGIGTELVTEMYEISRKYR